MSITDVTMTAPPPCYYVCPLLSCLSPAIMSVPCYHVCPLLSCLLSCLPPAIMSVPCYHVCPLLSCLLSCLPPAIMSVPCYHVCYHVCPCYHSCYQNFGLDHIKLHTCNHGAMFEHCCNVILPFLFTSSLQCLYIYFF